ncbi:MAG TPA: hypothetical protein VGV67_11830 [Solirubrobacteraceae bacterium]|nr:hypothetical protein [Solirubrobacteraceae bacterium]
MAGCGDDDDDEATTKPATAAPTPKAFNITATAQGKTKKALEFPSTVRAGLVQMTLTNEDTVPRSAQIIRVEGNHTVDEVLKIVNAEEAAKIPDWMQDGGGVAAVKPRDMGRAMHLLAPGKYVIWDDEGGMDEDAPGHAELGAKGEFTVTGPAVDAQLPRQPKTVTATDLGEGDDKKYDFEFEGGLAAGKNDVRFENTGEELHHALFFPIAKGKTFKDVEAAFTSGEEPQGPPPVDFQNAVGTVVIDGDIAQNITLELKAGKYAVVCFISDRDGGKSHAEKGMIEELTIE